MKTDVGGFNERSYALLTNACDRLLETPGSGPDRIAVESLHVLNQHPFQLEKYRELLHDLVGVPDKTPGYAKVGRNLYFLAYNSAALLRNFWRCASYRLQGKPVDFEDIAVDKVDVVIVSWLVNIDHLQETDDFYFGQLQAELAERGLTSLLVWRNQAGRPAAALMAGAARTEPHARMLLPDVAGLRSELGFLMKAAGIRRGLRRQGALAKDKIDRSVALFAAKQAVTHATVVNLRLQNQIERLCRQLQPSSVITLYEGYAWERNVWRGARLADDAIACAGYQHAGVQRLAHSVFRPLGDESRCDPDILLTSGEVTAGMFKRSKLAPVIEIIKFGSYRRTLAENAVEPAVTPAFLVLPEGIESECLFLFEFALACAALMPNVPFIFRTHPVLPFDKIRSKLSTAPHLPANFTLSDRGLIGADFSRTGYVLYRGSSSVFYAVIAGLKPLYVSKTDELSIDPLFELGQWRENVGSPAEVKACFDRVRQSSPDLPAGEWLKAKAYCDRYSEPIELRAMDSLADILIKVKSGVPNGVLKRKITHAG